MMIFGYVGVVHQPGSPWREIVTVFFAIGMGLALDEFALWVELKDVYWEKDGRKSIDAMILAGCLAGVLLVGFSAWVTLADDGRERGLRRCRGRSALVGIVFGLVNAAKEKLWWALASLIFWPVGIGPALRLGQAAFAVGAALLPATRGACRRRERALRRRRRRRDARVRRSGAAPRRLR